MPDALTICLVYAVAALCAVAFVALRLRKRRRDRAIEYLRSLGQAGGMPAAGDVKEYPFVPTKE